MSGLTPRGAHSSCAGHGDLSDQEIPRLVDSLVNRCVQHVSCGWYHTTVVVGMDPNISLLRYQQQLLSLSLSRNFTLAHILLTTRDEMGKLLHEQSDFFDIDVYCGQEPAKPPIRAHKVEHLAGPPLRCGLRYVRSMGVDTRSPLFVYRWYWQLGVRSSPRSLPPTPANKICTSAEWTQPRSPSFCTFSTQIPRDRAST